MSRSDDFALFMLLLFGGVLLFAYIISRVHEPKPTPPTKGLEDLIELEPGVWVHPNSPEMEEAGRPIMGPYWWLKLMIFAAMVVSFYHLNSGARTFLEGVFGSHR
ncbi:hypothetical protein T281_01575 [Rhodomicrobium udaipurense JA643]|uniref:Uncharacterized protein n=1 Tax=Rhodomicrobium udaipurense TaxID=1202716 RepID=A0A8I1GDS9_9HYPH|nr:hypothetical protein [Rhodomicrobium udaipurense]KAI96140.1 hypothetical protein T281_01575 [Rhodomicrobium udaipurense JA643]MBJ7545177.1 hypothetical protein [Rhodomicrobium udaipurense]